MFERIRLGSAAALAVSLTMVGSGIYIGTQDSGGGTAVDLASSVGSRTPTAASPDAAGETRSPAFVDGPTAAADPDAPADPAAPAAVGDPAAPAEAAPSDTPPGQQRPDAPVAYPQVSVLSSAPARLAPRVAPRVLPPTSDRDCFGYVVNDPQSSVTIAAEMLTGPSHAVVPGASYVGTSTNPVTGFSIPDPEGVGGLHIKIHYFRIGQGYDSTHDLNETAARPYDVSSCEESHVLVTNGVIDPSP